jgi:hypothetical protein
MRSLHRFSTLFLILISVIKTAGQPAFIPHRISFTATGTESLFVIDLDGKTDILVASSGLGEITWWKNEGGNPVTWTKYIVDGNFTRVWPLSAGDLDGDGDNDIVAASGVIGNNEVRWYENTLIVGLNEPGFVEQDRARVVLSPNPASDFLKISFPGQKYNSVRIDLYSGEARYIKTLFVGNSDPAQPGITIHLPGLCGGIYFLKIKTESVIINKKIILK